VRVGEKLEHMTAPAQQPDKTAILLSDRDGRGVLHPFGDRSQAFRIVGVPDGGTHPRIQLLAVEGDLLGLNG
jgi:hypothetical protein